jgi:sugar transferase (PEP-CTERM/EpsH1 system associated)
MAEGEPPLVVHIIYALGMGGMENGLVNIINRAPPGRYRHAIVCLTRSSPFAARLTAPGVQIYELDKKPGHDLGMVWRLFRLLRRLRPAIIHSRNLAAFEMQLVGLCVPGARRVHGEHGRDVYDLDGSNPRYMALRRVLRPFIHRYIAVSRDLETWLRDAVGIAADKVRQIYNGVDRERFHPRGAERPGLLPTGFLPDDGLLIGTVGRLVEVKDQRTLVQAFADLVGADPVLRARLRLALVGDGPLRGGLEAQAEALGVSDLLWLPGDRDDVAGLLREMDVFVLPSLAEGISNTVLEAMASGLPVIATRTGGNPELVEEGVNGYLFPVGDAHALAAQLAELVADAATRTAMGEQSRARVDARFNWPRAVDEYLSVYDSLLPLAQAKR